MLDTIVEVVGYIGMAFVVVSFAMKTIRVLRILNTIGAVLCCAYGFFTKTYPTAILNALLILINLSFPVRYLITLKKKTIEDIKEEDNLENKE